MEDHTSHSSPLAQLSTTSTSTTSSLARQLFQNTDIINHQKQLALPLISTVGPQVLQRAITNYLTETGLTREDFIALDWVFGSLIQSAFQILDDDSKVKDPEYPSTTSSSKPVPSDPVLAIFKCSTKYLSAHLAIVRVAASKGGGFYWIPMSKNLGPTSLASSRNNNEPTCQCISFKWRKDICKHILAAYFYFATTDKDEYLEMEEEEFNLICDQIIMVPK